MADSRTPKRISYYPGCSMATTARENNDSLLAMCRRLGRTLVELKDWNCCGSSSAHSLDDSLAVDLAARNLALAPAGRPLLAACPSCFLRLQHAHLHLKNHPEKQAQYEKQWGRPFDPDLKIIHYFDMLAQAGLDGCGELQKLSGLSFAAYYGCMLARPPEMQNLPDHRGIMEKTLSCLGATALPWGFGGRCCGTFLSVVRPDVVTPLVDEIMMGAVKAGADCIVTACAMCHLNLEIRCSAPEKIPILHFSELLAIALGEAGKKDWFTRHIINPIPLLKSRGLL